MRFVRHSASALAFLCLYTMPLTAQNTGTVRGQVVDSTTRQALAGVTVQIQGTARSTLTGPAGNYSLGDVPGGSGVRRAGRIRCSPRPAGAACWGAGATEGALRKSPPRALVRARLAPRAADPRTGTPH